MNFKALLSTALLTVAGSVFAQSQPQISPQSIIVNPVQNDLQVSVRVDRAGENPSYNIGERIRITASVNQDAYVYLFSVHSDGQIDLILPNQLSSGNVFLRAGETRSFPPSTGGYLLQVDGPVGQDKVLAVASKRQLNIDELASFKGNQPFATITVTRSGQRLGHEYRVLPGPTSRRCQQSTGRHDRSRASHHPFRRGRLPGRNPGR
jgi:hypothetical protein